MSSFFEITQERVRAEKKQGGLRRQWGIIVVHHKEMQSFQLHQKSKKLVGWETICAKFAGKRSGKPRKETTQKHSVGPICAVKDGGLLEIGGQLNVL